MATAKTEVLINRREVAELLGVGKSTIDHWAADPRPGPSRPALRFPPGAAKARVRYRPSDVLKWAAGRQPRRRATK